MELTKHEHYIPGEREAMESLEKTMEHKMSKETAPNSKMTRDAHPKQIALLKAEFVIESNLPDSLSHGLFSVPRSYPCWVRFSNQNSPKKPDIKKDIRGVAIKLMGVAGEKILTEEKEASTQDFIMISTSYFVTKNIVDFSKLMKSLVSGSVKLFSFFLLHPKVAYNLLSSNKNFGSLLEARFWSVAPYLLGDKAVKYSLVPTEKDKTGIPKNPSDNYLQETMVEQLANKAYEFNFMVQFQKDPIRMPVEDLSNSWSEKKSPFIKVATLKIPKQSFDSREQQDFGDNLSFTPWHSLPDHRPLGNISRGRKLIYDMLSKFRHRKNNTLRREPIDFTINNK